MERNGSTFLSLRLLATRKRFILPVLGIASVRMLYALFLYYSLRVGSNFSVPFMTWKFRLPYDWLYLFSAWDSGFYREIAISWYPAKLSPFWSFFPLYPATIRTLSIIGIDPGLGAFLVSTICGFASIPVFQNVAEGYFERRQALIATSMYFLFPPVFVFSAATYPESLLLLLSLLSWRFHRKGREAKACLAAGLSSLARPEGILIIIPLLYDYLQHKQFSKLGYLLLPLAATAGWELYGFIITGVWLPTRAAGIFWRTTQTQAVRNAISSFLQGNVNSAGILFPYVWLIFAIVAILGIVLFLGWRNWWIDRALSMYLLVSTFLLAISTGVAYRSFPRILSFLFPIGLPFHSRNMRLLVLIFLLFLALDYVAWLAFLVDGFY